MLTNSSNAQWRFKDLLFLIIIPCLVGILLAAFIPQPVVGLIEMRDPIDNFSGKALLEQIQYAYKNNRIKAVVVIIDCPGGTVNDTELVFLEMKKLSEKKPVIAMVQGLSASGAYYVSMAADEIVSNPSAMVGNVGVIGNLPPHPFILEDVYSTGPYKLWGTSRDTYVRQIETMQEGFLNAVEYGRGELLVISREEVSRGEIYAASDALKIGMIDSLGPQSSAIDLAAKKAHIAHYRTAYLDHELEIAEADNNWFYAFDEDGEMTGYPKEPGFYYLYIPDIKGGLR
jgi:protease-4